MGEHKQKLESLIRMMQLSIQSVEQSATSFPESQRALKRVLAHLWSAHDELELIDERPLRSVG